MTDSQPGRTVVRKWVRPEDLNQHGSLHGGSLLKWIDEEAAILAIFQLGNKRLVTRFISEIEFVDSAFQGDLLEIELTVASLGRTSITISARVENVFSRREILNVSKIVFVGLDEHGQPKAHGFTEVTGGKDRI